MILVFEGRDGVPRCILHWSDTGCSSRLEKMDIEFLLMIRFALLHILGQLGTNEINAHQIH